MGFEGLLGFLFGFKDLEDGIATVEFVFLELVDGFEIVVFVLAEDGAAGTDLGFVLDADDLEGFGVDEAEVGEGEEVGGWLRGRGRGGEDFDGLLGWDVLFLLGFWNNFLFLFIFFFFLCFYSRNHFQQRKILRKIPDVPVF